MLISDPAERAQKSQEKRRALLRFLAAPANAGAIEATGLEAAAAPLPITH